MFKKSIATFFSIIFIALSTAPSIIVAVDDSLDVSIFYGCAEEEEKKNENTKSFELIFSNGANEKLPYSNANNISLLVYICNDYPKPHLNLISPPPEFI